MKETTKGLLLRTKHRAHLEDTVVRRKGLRAKGWYDTIDDLIAVRGRNGAARDTLAIHFTLPAGGQGNTFVEVAIKAKDFPAIVALMAATDREAAMRAMAEEMRYQLCGKSN